MSYTTAVKDRTLADIAARNSKAFFNVADWTRIKNNEQVTRNLAEILLSISVSATAIGNVETTDIPKASVLNTLLTNIENLRLAVASESIPGTDTEIKDDYTGGLSGTSPTWKDANLWESTIDAIWVYIHGMMYDNCPTLTVNLTVTTGNHEIYIDCLDTDNYQVDLQGTATLYII
jgi:hypothetical protein